MSHLQTNTQTSDALIRKALLTRLRKQYPSDKYRIVPELGLWHGTARIDVAVVNGIMHGYEIKSDRDTLIRLENQIHAYGAVFDRVTLVVGRSHMVDAFKQAPVWWGIETVGMNAGGEIVFNTIREPEDNPHQDILSIARLLWRSEALGLLENVGKADGVRSKPRDAVYERLLSSVEPGVLKEHVRNVLQYSRQAWRSDVQPA